MEQGHRPIGSLPTAVLAIGDAVALILFVLVGVASHDETFTAARLVRDATPILVGWFGVALVVQTYVRPGAWIVVLTWAIAMPVAVTIRTIWFGHPTGGDFLAFLAVQAGVTGVLLGSWRVVAGLFARRLPTNA